LIYYPYGAIGEWMYERIAGIAPLEPGYKVIKIAPQARQPLHSAAASLDTPFGTVSSSWEIVDNSFNLEVVVPPNTAAIVVVPANTQKDLLVDGTIFTSKVNQR